MFMIETIYPFGSVNIKEVKGITTKLGRFYLIDQYGLWRIEETTYQELESRGIKVYERQCSAT